MINNPRAARSATVAPISGATTVTTAPVSSNCRMADSAAGPPPQTSTGSPSSSRLAEKPDGGWICMAARGYHSVSAAPKPHASRARTCPSITRCSSETVSGSRSTPRLRACAAS